MIEEIHCVTLGDKYVGKSSLMLKFCKNAFDGMSSPTLGAAFLSRIV